VSTGSWGGTVLAGVLGGVLAGVLAGVVVVAGLVVVLVAGEVDPVAALVAGWAGLDDVVVPDAEGLAGFPAR
jgi:hypothetical protein